MAHISDSSRPATRDRWGVATSKSVDPSVYTLLDDADADDMLTLWVEENNKNILKVKIENFKKNKTTETSLNMLDLVDPELTLPVVEFEAVVMINSKEFYNMCSGMKRIGEYIEIKCLSDKLIFHCISDFGETTTTYYSKDDSNIQVISFDENPDVKGLFHLDDFLLFSPYNTLCKDINIYMTNGQPLAIKYKVGTLGSLIVGIAPIIDEFTDGSVKHKEISSITI